MIFCKKYDFLDIEDSNFVIYGSIKNRLSVDFIKNNLQKLTFFLSKVNFPKIEFS